MSSATTAPDEEQQQEYDSMVEGSPVVRKKKRKHTILERDPLGAPRKVTTYRDEEEQQSVEDQDLDRISME